MSSYDDAIRRGREGAASETEHDATVRRLAEQAVAALAQSFVAEGPPLALALTKVGAAAAPFPMTPPHGGPPLKSMRHKGWSLLSDGLLRDDGTWMFKERGGMRSTFVPGFQRFKKDRFEAVPLTLNLSRTFKSIAATGSDAQAGLLRSLVRSELSGLLGADGSLSADAVLGTNYWPVAVQEGSLVYVADRSTLPDSGPDYEVVPLRSEFERIVERLAARRS